MEKISEKTKFSLRLLVDEKRNKVVLAEACMHFVDVLFSLLTLPMGTIVRLLEKHKPQKLREVCFHNIYRSVSDMAIDDFETEACKSMLLYPRSTKEIHCRRLKLNIDDTEATKFFTCPLFPKESCKQYNNFNTSRCSCGDLMTRQFQVSEEDQIENNEDGVFVRCRSSYIVTDDLRVTLNSLGVITKELNVLGYEDFDDLKETHLDVGFEEVLTLLGNFFASEFPLSHTFLRKPFLELPKTLLLSTHAVEVGCVHGGLECHVKLFVRKFDRKILYAECSEDFIESLLSLLVLPLELANNNAVLGCVGNLCRSECRDPSASSTPWEIPYYYTCSKQILDIQYQPAVVYSYIRTKTVTTPAWKFVRHVKNPKNPPLRSINVIPIDPKIKSESPSKYGVGFVKRDTRFIVTDDLVITPMSSSSTIDLFMNSKINNTSALEEKEVSISKAELINILRASLISRSALTNGLSSMLAKKRKKQVLGIL